MKSFIISVLFSFTSFLALAQWQTGGTLQVIVKGDIAILLDDSCWRDCGAHYEMIVTVSGNHIEWLQDDISGGAFCDCPVDLAVSVAHLPPGNYTTDAYYTTCYGPTHIYIGSIGFIIPDVINPDSLEIVDPYQSTCLLLNTENHPDTRELLSSASPNPFKDQSYILYDNRGGEQNHILIFNSTGVLVRKFSIPKNLQGLIT